MSDADDRIRDQIATWDAATGQIRDVVKWIASAFAGLGALLIGTAPLSGLPKIDVSAGSVLAVSGFAVLGLGSTAFIVWRTTDLLTPTALTLAEVNTDGRFQGLRTTIAAEPTAYLGSWAASLGAFVEARDAAITDLTQILTAESIERNDGKLASLKEAETAAKDRIDSAGRVTQRLLAVARFTDVSKKFNDAKLSLFVAASLVVVGMVGFLVTIGVATPADPTPVTAVHLPAIVSLTAQGTTIGRTLGPHCPAAFRAVVLEGGSVGPWKILVDNRGCRAGVIQVAADEAKVLLVYPPQ